MLISTEYPIVWPILCLAKLLTFFLRQKYVKSITKGKTARMTPNPFLVSTKNRIMFFLHDFPNLSLHNILILTPKFLIVQFLIFLAFSQLRSIAPWREKPAYGKTNLSTSAPGKEKPLGSSMIVSLKQDHKLGATISDSAKDNYWHLKAIYILK